MFSMLPYVETLTVDELRVGHHICYLDGSFAVVQTIMKNDECVSVHVVHNDHEHHYYESTKQLVKVWNS